MAPGLLDLPLEIRLDIYSLVFGCGKAVIEPKNDDDSSCLLPLKSERQNQVPRSSQLLRVSRTILLEARPVLYANTTFHVLTQVFAGKLPSAVTNGHPSAPYIKHLIWQLDCDMLKHVDTEELRLDSTEAGQWSSLEIRCRAEAWRYSFLGEWVSLAGQVVYQWSEVGDHGYHDETESETAPTWLVNLEDVGQDLFSTTLICDVANDFAIEQVQEGQRLPVDIHRVDWILLTRGIQEGTAPSSIDATVMPCTSDWEQGADAGGCQHFQERVSFEERQSVALARRRGRRRSIRKQH
ncbi:uncharacterized protein Z518_02663 [Rhinocladiella mackenziei CBS 650.93]|uniref:Uncharacterized protein n=1 Tax=Rhinocladiella mackenziei CBS 650.93 TaxID=1442369 RepID=A0A0D2HC64_9EURO|nr:uncharacterized protein Z518_02663 [Rhinocladiella mackenziei CBS 650.93]KIX08008.1 hypothetical protein Z518_02663 [Rhinocladiella mackenziei CBS 650.93]